MIYGLLRKRVLALASLYGVGIWLASLGQDLALPYGAWAPWGVFFVLLSFLASLVGWGIWATRRLGWDGTGFADYFALGAGIYAFWAYGLSLLGAIGPNQALLFHGFLLLGLLWVPALPPFLNPQDLLKVRRDEPVAMLTIAAVLIVVLLQAQRLHFLQDGMVYHLLGPEAWWREGTLAGWREQPQLFHAGFWDALGFAALAAFSRDAGQGLVSVHLFSQLLNASLALGGALLVLYRVAGYCLRERAWAFWVLLGALVLEPILWTAWNPKNDYGALFWLLYALLCLLPLGRAQPRVLIAGVFLGLASGTKLFHGVAAVAAILAWWISRRENVGGLKASRETLLIMVGAAIPLVLVVFRNGYYLGAPLFPLETSWWPTPTLSTSVREFMLGVHGSDPIPLSWTWGQVATRIWQLQLEWIPALLLAIPLWVRFRKNNFGFICGFFFLVTIIGLAAYGPRIFQEHTIRFFALSLVLGRLVLVAALANFISRTPLVRSGWLTWVRMLPALAWVVFSFVPWGVVGMPSPDANLAVVEAYRGGQCKAWLRGQRDRALLLNDDFLYYLPAKLVASGYYHQGADAWLRSGKESDLVFQGIRELGFRFVYDDFGPEAAIYFSDFAARRQWLIERSARGLAFRGKDCVVIDLHKN